jgi:RNA polymerase sigma-70 factor (ECF subfamily)
MADLDAELVRRWRRGEAAAFETLVRRWEQRLARFLGRLVGDPTLVQDLCQEVFLRAYLAGDRYRESGTFSAWLYQIALNAARDAARRRRHLPQPLHNHEPAAGAPRAETQYEQQELQHVLAEALAELPGPLREVLALRHDEGLSFEEMARVLETPASTLKSRFAAALGRLRARLRQLGWGHEEINS